MARRMRRGKPVERGWKTVELSLELEHTDVDNVVTSVADILRYEDLIDQDEEEVLTGQDRVAEYYLEVGRGFKQATATFAVGNATGGLPYWWGFLVGDAVAFDDLSGIGSITSFPVMTDNFRGFEALRQVSQANLELATVNYFPGERMDQGALPWFRPVELGRMHLRRGEALYLWASQTGVGDNFQSWVGSDAVRIDLHLSLLLRKKRGE